MADTTFDRAAADNYLAALPPHVAERMGAKLLRAALAEIDSLMAEIVAMRSTIALSLEPPKLMAAAVDAQRRADGYSKKLVGLADENARLRAALDIGTLRGYHDSSFADPPSYHEAGVSDLWDCPQCVEQFIGRAAEVLGES